METMTLKDLNSLFRNEGHKHFQILLPDGAPVPHSFHITEVGNVRKTFIDCGGVVRETSTCQLQVWVGDDFDHRIEAKKAAAILDKAKSIVPDDSLPVEVEYEDQVISQYTIEGHEITDSAVILKLANKHTTCLARELCGLPSPAEEESTCCAPGCCR